MEKKEKKLIHPPYERLKRCLKEQRITYEQVGELLGITATTVSLKMNGQSDFYWNEGEKMKQAYGLRKDVFF